jgi:hypothetical protein
MPKKSTVQEGSPKGSKPTKAKGQSHTAKHIEETARLAGSIEPNKDLRKGPQSDGVAARLRGCKE